MGQKVILWYLLEVLLLKIRRVKHIKLKWLQIRIVHLIIATNVVLKKIAITNCEQSTLYYDEKDSVEHFFWRCFFAKRFWQALENIISKSCKTACYVEITENKHSYYWCRFWPHDFISKLIPFIDANLRNVWR